VIGNDYLEDFYRDPAKYGFELQIHLLNQRFTQQQQLVWSNEGGIQDRTIYEDEIFAKMLWQSGKMEERAYHTYVTLFRNMSKLMRHPNVIIHLQVSPEQSLQRVQARNRDMESALSLEYLQRLHTGYEEFLREISKSIPVLKVDWETFRSEADMVEMLKRELEQLHTIREINWSEVY